MGRFKINRIGLLNYWLYDEEEFYFYDGKLLLRGTNGSGKSVTMVSFFPLLFDGNKNPERFDTFGSRDRKVEDYVLPPDFEGNENTSYLYMEFYHKEIDKYLTIGIGLRAIRNRNVEFYGFAITDNRRIKQDFMLYKDRLRKIPLTKRELQSEIGAGGEFVTTIKDYKNMVNRLLFGFENDGLYSELINLMLQLRSPKLSKDYKPTKLEEILSGVLEPISEKDIQTMSESIENMNKYKEKIEDLTLENSAATNLINSFYDYSNTILYHKCDKYLQAKKSLENTLNDTHKLKQDIDNLQNNIFNENKRANEIKLELNEIQYKEENLDAKDLDALLNDKIKFQEEIKVAEKNKQEKEEMLETKDSKKVELKNNIDATNNHIYEKEKEIHSMIEQLRDKSNDLYYNETLFYLDEIEEKLDGFQFDMFYKDLEKEKEKIKALAALVAKKKELESQKIFEEDYILKYQNEIKTYEKEKKTLTEEFFQEIEKLKLKIDSYQNNKVLIFDQDDLINMKNLFDKASDDLVYIQNLFLDKYKSELNHINKEILALNNKLENEQEEIKKLENSKNEVNQTFENNLDIYETKDYLIKNNIEAKYLYEVIEFKDSVKENTRKKIEKALKSMGILQAFVVKNKIQDNIDIKTFDNFAYEKDSILDYFNIIDKDYEEEVKNILGSISKTKGNIKIQDNGKYALGIISGQVTDEYDLKFIGEEIRNDYIFKKLEEYDLLIKQHNENIQSIREQIKSAENDLFVLEKEYNDIPNNKTYLEHLQSLKEKDIKLKIIKDNIDEKSLVINDLSKEIIQLQEEINLNKKYYNGPLNYEGLNTVLDNFLQFKESLLVLQNILSDYGNQKMLLDTLNNSLDDLMDSITSLKLEIDDINFSIKNTKGKILKLDEIVNSDKYRNLKEELEALKLRKLELNDEDKLNYGSLIRHQKELEIHTEELNKVNLKIQEEQKIVNALEKIFRDEYNLKYSNYINDCDDVNKWFRNFKMDKVLSISDALEKFTDSINRYIPKLQNYAGRKISILNYDEDTRKEFTDNNQLSSKLNELFSEAKRSDLEFRYSGKILNLLELHDALDLELTTTQSLLNDEDRKLFEDLLMNNIGDSIRKKIHSSNEWVREVRDLMESMNTSSGLSFSIKWSGKMREAENELDTIEIVDIFERDPKTLKDEDLQKITNHFRSKIALEEEKYEESERNYLEIIRNVLDYRKWYEFKLFFKRPNSDKKELTDKEFSKFSGGEKAIAMYVPLFAGIYAKFNSAKEDAPRVIALDEAFAGVDDDNIQDCFRILNQMDLDYVLTSQILWGDYSTVKHLAICELHHLPSTNVVSIIKYKWDGIKRSIITSNEEYQN